MVIREKIPYLQMTKEMKGVEFLQHFQREESGSFFFFLRCSLVIKMTWGGNTLGQTLTMEDENRTRANKGRGL